MAQHHTLTTHKQQFTGAYSTSHVEMGTDMAVPSTLHVGILETHTFTMSVWLRNVIMDGVRDGMMMWANYYHSKKMNVIFICVF